MTDRERSKGGRPRNTTPRVRQDNFVFRMDGVEGELCRYLQTIENGGRRGVMLTLMKVGYLVSHKGVTPAEAIAASTMSVAHLASPMPVAAPAVPPHVSQPEASEPQPAPASIKRAGVFAGVKA